MLKGEGAWQGRGLCCVDLPLSFWMARDPSRFHPLVSVSIWRARLCVGLHESVQVCLYVLVLGGGTRWEVGVEV